VKTSRPARFVHLLTAIHATGAVACFTMAVGSAISPGFRESLVVSPGSALMTSLFGARTWIFLTGVGSFLVALAYASWKKRRRAWPMTVTAYGIGVLGSLWEVSEGVPQGWLAAAINAAVVAYASTPGVRRAYREG
jgi:hypothetical protein